MTPHCDLCSEHNLDIDGPYHREFNCLDGSKVRKNLCLYHESARRRLAVYRQREARAVCTSSRLSLDPQTNRTLAHQVQ